MNSVAYKNSDDAAFKRMVRSAIRKSKMTKSDRDITLALVNLWFYHRNGHKKYIHPGRKHLAKKAGVGISTVSRCLSKLRQAQAIIPIKSPRGEGQRPTQYVVNIHSLLVLCGCDWLGEFTSKCVTTFPQNDPPLVCRNDPQYNNICNVLPFQSKPSLKSKVGG